MDDFIFYVQQGFFHVLDVYALDHVLFFIALAIVYDISDWKKTLGLITFFTFSHSFTFALSTYNILSIPVDLVEFIIPITILIPLILNIYKSFSHSFSKVTNTNIIFAFFFGLIHGLGFSNYFKILLDKGDDKLIPLLEFALGIEFAQIAVVLIVLIFGYWMKNNLKIQQKSWIKYISILLIIVILPMLVKRYPF